MVCLPLRSRRCTVPVLSDKLFVWLFQNQPDRIVSLCGDLPVDAAGYRFVAPDPGFLRRLYAESARLL